MIVSICNFKNAVQVVAFAVFLCVGGGSFLVSALVAQTVISSTGVISLSVGETGVESREILPAIV